MWVNNFADAPYITDKGVKKYLIDMRNIVTDAYINQNEISELQAYNFDSTLYTIDDLKTRNEWKFIYIPLDNSYTFTTVLPLLIGDDINMTTNFETADFEVDEIRFHNRELNKVELKELYMYTNLVQAGDTINIYSKFNEKLNNSVTPQIKLDSRDVTQLSNFDSVLTHISNNDSYVLTSYKIPQFTDYSAVGNDGVSYIPIILGEDIPGNPINTTLNMNSILNVYKPLRINPAFSKSTYSTVSFKFNGPIFGKKSASKFRNPKGITNDGNGNLYITDNNAIRKINIATGIVNSISGRGDVGYSEGINMNALYNNSQGLVYDGNNNLYVVDTDNHVIRKINTNTKNTTNICGVPGSRGWQTSEDVEVWGDVRNNLPIDITLVSNRYLYFSDLANRSIKRIDLQNNNFVTKLDIGWWDNIISPKGIVNVGSDIYYVDSYYKLVRKVQFIDRTILTNIVENLDNPYGIEYDGSNFLYVSEHLLNKFIKIDITNGSYVTLNTTGLSINRPTHFTYYNNRLYFGDEDHQIKELDLSTNIITAISGIAGQQGFADDYDRFTKDMFYLRLVTPNTGYPSTRFKSDYVIHENDSFILGLGDFFGLFDGTEELEVLYDSDKIFDNLGRRVAREPEKSNRITVQPTIKNIIRNVDETTDLSGGSYRIATLEAGADTYSVLPISEPIYLAIGAIQSGYPYKKGYTKIYEFKSNEWSQIDSTIFGEKLNDMSGGTTDLTPNGKIIAIGAKTNDDGKAINFDCGHVRVFQYKIPTSIEWNDSLVVGYDSFVVGPNIQLERNINSNKKYWVQVGSDIDGKTKEEEFGHSVSIKYDGSILATSGYKWKNETGYVRVFNYKIPTNDEWISLDSVVIKGSDIQQKLTKKYWVQMGNIIYGPEPESKFGSLVKFNNNANILLVSSPYYSNKKGFIEVYQWDGSNWIQKGSRLEGISDGQFGKSISMNGDGTIIAAAAPYATVAGNSYAGYVKVYKWDGTDWDNINTIYGGAYDNCGASISISNNGDILGFNIAGETRFYRFNGSNYSLDSTRSITEGYASGGLSLNNDGTIVSIGEQGYQDLVSSNYVGRVRTFQWNGTSWTMKGSHITGVEDNDFFGKSVSIASSIDHNYISAAPNNLSISRTNNNIFNYENQDTFVFKVKAVKGSETRIRPFSFKINDKNDKHTLLLSQNTKTIFERPDPDSVLCEIGIVDEDLSQTYTIDLLENGLATNKFKLYGPSGVDLGNSTTINKDSVLTLKTDDATSNLDFETATNNQHNILVKCTCDSSTFAEKQFVLRLLDVNEGFDSIVLTSPNANSINDTKLTSLDMNEWIDLSIQKNRRIARIWIVDKDTDPNNKGGEISILNDTSGSYNGLSVKDYFRIVSAGNLGPHYLEVKPFANLRKEFFNGKYKIKVKVKDSESRFNTSVETDPFTLNVRNTFWYQIRDSVLTSSTADSFLLHDSFVLSSGDSVVIEDGKKLSIVDSTLTIDGGSLRVNAGGTINIWGDNCSLIYKSGTIINNGIINVNNGKLLLEGSTSGSNMNTGTININDGILQIDGATSNDFNTGGIINTNKNNNNNININATFYNNGTIKMKGGYINIKQGTSFYNEKKLDLNNKLGGKLKINGLLENQDEITSHDIDIFSTGTLRNNNGKIIEVGDFKGVNIQGNLDLEINSKFINNGFVRNEKRITINGIFINKKLTSQLLNKLNKNAILIFNKTSKFYNYGELLNINTGAIHVHTNIFENYNKISTFVTSAFYIYDSIINKGTNSPNIHGVDLTGITGTIINTDSIIIKPNSKLVNKGIIQNSFSNAEILNKGTIYNSNQIKISGGIIENDSTILNNGTIEIENIGKINNKNYGNIENLADGTFTITSGELINLNQAKFKNNNEFTNNSLGTIRIKDSSIFTNNSRLNNTGKIYDSYIFNNNLGAELNNNAGGRLYHDSILINNGTFINYGILNSTDSAMFTNNYIFKNWLGATFTNQTPLTIQNTFINYGEIFSDSILIVKSSHTFKNYNKVRLRGTSKLVANGKLINYEKNVNNDDVDLSNDSGLITITTNAKLTNNNSLSENRGYIISDNEFTNDSTFTNSGTITLNHDVSGGKTVGGLITNNATFNNSGDIIVFGNGKISNSKIINHTNGTITLNGNSTSILSKLGNHAATSVLNIESALNIKEFGKIHNKISAIINLKKNTLTNEGLITIDNNTTFNNESTLDNKKKLEIKGILKNDKNITNTGDIVNTNGIINANTGTITNKNNIYNYDSIVNNGIININDTTDGGVIFNYKTFNNNNGAKLNIYDSFVNMEKGASNLHSVTTTNDSGTLTNIGTININTGLLENKGRLISKNYAIVTISGSGTLTNKKNFYNQNNSVFTITDGKFTNDTNGVFYHTSSKTITNNDSIVNNGIFEDTELIINNRSFINNYEFSNSRKFINNDTFINNYKIYIQEEFINNGTFNNIKKPSFLFNYLRLDAPKKFENDGVFNNQKDARFYIFGTFNNNENSTFNNKGTITNENTASIVNNSNFNIQATGNDLGQLTNSGTITNNKTLSNLGTIRNDSYLINNTNGTFTSDKNINNYGTITNENRITLNSYSVFNNYHIITNNEKITNSGSLINNPTDTTNTSFDDSGVITNNKTFDNEGTLINKSKIINNTAATFTNEGTLTDSNCFINNNNFVNNNTLNINNLFENNDTFSNINSGLVNIGTFGILSNKSNGIITNNKDGIIYDSGIINNQTTNNKFDNFGSVYILGSGSIVNDGNLNVKLVGRDSGVIYNSSLIDNNKTFTINGKVYNYSPSSIVNDGEITLDNFMQNAGLITNNKTFTNNANGRLIIDSTLGKFVNETNNAVLTNSGTIDNKHIFIHNNGTFTNKNIGIINNNDSILINNDMTNQGTINNYDSFTLSKDNILTNTGVINNDSTFINFGGIITSNRLINTATFENYDSIVNTGTLTTSGIFNNHDSLTLRGSIGRIINKNNFTISGTFTNKANIRNDSIMTLSNNSTFKNDSYLINNTNGTFNIEGAFTNDSTFINNGSINIKRTGVFTNNDSLIINPSSKLVNEGRIVNNKLTSRLINKYKFENKGGIVNYGKLAIETSQTMTHEGDSTITNYYLFNNYGTFTNTGYFVNKEKTGTVNGIDFTNIHGTITNKGTFIHNDNKFDNKGLFKNEFTASVFEIDSTMTVSGTDGEIENNGIIKVLTNGFLNYSSTDFTNKYEVYNYGRSIFNNLVNDFNNISDTAKLYNYNSLRFNGKFENKRGTLINYELNAANSDGQDLIGIQGNIIIDNNNGISTIQNINESPSVITNKGIITMNSNNSNSFKNQSTITNNNRIILYRPLLNESTLNNNKDANITVNYKLFNNSGGTITNEGIIDIKNTGSQLSNSDTLNNETDGVINIDAGTKLDNSGAFENDNVITINGTLSNSTTSGNITNNNTITNNGNIVNKDTITNSSTGTINNNNDFYNYDLDS